MAHKIAHGAYVSGEMAQIWPRNVSARGYRGVWLKFASQRFWGKATLRPKLRLMTTQWTTICYDTERPRSKHGSFEFAPDPGSRMETLSGVGCDLGFLQRLQCCLQD